MKTSNLICALSLAILEHWKVMVVAFLVVSIVLGSVFILGMQYGRGL